MATRWQKIREQLKPIMDKEIITAQDLLVLHKLKQREFKCSLCEYLDVENQTFACKANYRCRQGCANYLNEEVKE